MSSVDAIVVGYGWSGAIVARRLVEAGLRVTVLERGPARERTACGHLHLPGGERVPASAVQPVDRETFTLRHETGADALPFRRLGSFLSGSGQGGSGVLWGGTAARWRPEAFRPRTTHDLAAAAEHAPAVVDWPFGYHELEPGYARFEREIGVAGDAAGTPHETLRSTGFPVAAPPDSDLAARYRAVVEKRGWTPHVLPSAEHDTPYTNSDGIHRAPCDEHPTTMATPLDTLHPAAAASGLLKVVTGAQVHRVRHVDGRVTGVTYTHGGRRHDLDAPRVVLAAWTLHTTRLALLSGIAPVYDPDTGSGVVGRGYANHVAVPARGWFDDVVGGRPPFGGVGFLDLDPSVPGAGFAGAGYQMLHPSTNPSPTAAPPIPPSTPRWGAAWKDALRDNRGRSIQLGTIGEILPHPRRHLDLDPRYRDAWGDPLLRITFDWAVNERRLYAHHQGVMAGLLRDLGAQDVELPPLPDHYDLVRYQNTHATGGTIAGDDPALSVVDPTLEAWDVRGLWVSGASVFPSASAPPPTLTVGAVAHRVADHVIASGS